MKKEQCEEVLKDFYSKSITYLSGYDNTKLCYLFSKIYNTLPYCIYTNCLIAKEFNVEAIYIESSLFDKLKEEYKNDEVFFINDMLFTDDGLFSSNTYIFTNYNIPERLKKYFKNLEETSNYFSYIAVDPSGEFVDNMFEVKDYNVKIKEQYNDDLPIETIDSFIDTKDSGIALFHGIPGTGKTTFIRHLISTHPKASFCWLDTSLLYRSTNQGFINFLLDHKNNIIILEDSEVLLQSRNNTHNELLSTILNLSDGIVGDSLNIRLICTFNTNLENLDKAVLRKGRLKIRYEFRSLSSEKSSKLLGEKVTKDMTLADIYNYKASNEIIKKQHKIGF